MRSFFALLVLAASGLGCSTDCTLALVFDSLTLNLEDPTGATVAVTQGVISVGDENLEFVCGADGELGSVDSVDADTEITCDGGQLVLSLLAGSALQERVAIAAYDDADALRFGSAVPTSETFEPNGEGCGDTYTAEATIRVLTVTEP